MIGYRLYRFFIQKETTFKNLILKISSLILLRRKLEKSNFERAFDLLFCLIPEVERGHKAQGQGHKKNPRSRPRIAFPRTDTLEAKDRNARGQGQGPRTQAQVLSKKKKGLHKNFSSDLHEKTFSKKFFKRSTKF